MEASNLAANTSKNRYRDILPYDSTRVRLMSTNPVGGDYINANFVPVRLVPSFLFVDHSVQGYHKKVEYIVTQGPLRTTLSDFWSMVWDNDCRVITMMTKLMEGGREKVYQASCLALWLAMLMQRAVLAQVGWRDRATPADLGDDGQGMMLMLTKLRGDCWSGGGAGRLYVPHAGGQEWVWLDDMR